MKASRLTALKQAIDIVNGLRSHADGAVYLTCSDCRQMLIRAIAEPLQAERSLRRGAGRRKRALAARPSKSKTASRTPEDGVRAIGAIK